MPPTTRPGRLSAALLISLALNAALAAGAGYLVFMRKDPAAATPGAPGGTSGPAGGVNALGRVQPKGGVVGVGGVPGDRVKEVKVALGREVKKDDVLLTTTGDEERRLSLATLAAQLHEAEEGKKAAEKAKVAKLAAAKSEREQAEGKARDALIPLDAEEAATRSLQAEAQAAVVRVQRAKTNGAPVSEQEELAARSALDRLNVKADALDQQRKAAKKQLEAALAGAAAQMEAAEAEAARQIAMIPTESLKAAHAAAKQRLEASVVRSPINGRVVKVGVQVGDALGMAPAVQVANTADMVVVAEVYETDIPRLREWVTGRSPYPAKIDPRVLGGAAKDKLTGTTTLDRVAPMIARNQVFALGPREDADRRVVEVEVSLGSAESKRVADLIGLQVRVEFDPPGGGK